MKNIHILPTDKPTGIFESKNGLHFSIIEKIRYGEFKGFHIYITSDEEIKDGDWFVQVNTKKIIKHHPKNGLLLQPQSFDKKVILTTDQDLIKDGVQEIDEEYLEWFVKNPSCDYVEIEDSVWDGISKWIPYYDIIIPEEPKQIKCYCGHTITCDCEPLQETIEDAAERESQLGEYDRSFESTRKNYFIKGAKWQQERMYSEEDMKKAIRFGFDKGFCSNSSNKNKNLGLSEKEWFEQYKKK
jgi:hypothetical protein